MGVANLVRHSVGVACFLSKREQLRIVSANGGDRAVHLNRWLRCRPQVEVVDVLETHSSATSQRCAIYPRTSENRRNSTIAWSAWRFCKHANKANKYPCTTRHAEKSKREEI